MILRYRSDRVTSLLRILQCLPVVPRANPTLQDTSQQGLLCLTSARSEAWSLTAAPAASGPASEGLLPITPTGSGSHLCTLPGTHFPALHDGRFQMATDALARLHQQGGLRPLPLNLGRLRGCLEQRGSGRERPASLWPQTLRDWQLPPPLCWTPAWPARKPPACRRGQPPTAPSEAPGVRGKPSRIHQTRPASS